MKINKIIMIVISIILVTFLHSILITESHIEYIPGIVTYDGKVIRETTTNYYPPQILGMGVPTGFIGFVYLIFIQSVPGLILQIFVIYILLKKLVVNMKWCEPMLSDVGFGLFTIIMITLYILLWILV